MLFLSCISHSLQAQQQDTSYIKTYYSNISARIYASQKYTNLRIRDKDANYDLLYRPNTPINLGVGATYRFLTLNVSYGFDFMNPERGRGKTEYLDLQAHAYTQKMTIDVFGQFYNGFYLTPKGTAALEDEYYVRPDMEVFETGLSCQYLFNNKRFSYRAAFLHNEWQKQSAGTFLLGFEGYYGRIKADSTLVPTGIDDSIAVQNIRNVEFFDGGPNIGYAYTVVIARHFFITGSLAFSIDYGRNNIRGDGIKRKQTGFSSNSFVRAFAGYNSERWACSISYHGNNVSLAENAVSELRKSLNTGNIRLNLVYRFVPDKTTKKILKPVDKVDSWINKLL